MNACQYLHRGTFTVVITPHAIERQFQRDFDNGHVLPWNTIEAALEYNNRDQFVRVRGFQMFCNKRFNVERNREEVEVISFCPDAWQYPSDVCVLTIK